jgi:hypothetical protein
VLNFTKFPLGFKEDLFSLFVEGIYEKSVLNFNEFPPGFSGVLTESNSLPPKLESSPSLDTIH